MFLVGRIVLITNCLLHSCLLMLVKAYRYNSMTFYMYFAHFDSVFALLLCRNMRISSSDGPGRSPKLVTTRAAAS